MSRPKSLKYGSGEVLLKNLTDEEKTAVTKLLSGPETEVVETEDGFEVKEVVPEAPKVELGYSALSICKIGVMWHLVLIKFNPETKDMSFEDLKPLHTNKNIALHRFAVEQMKSLGR